MAGHTYSFTTEDGVEHHRYSARHLAPIYTHAAIAAAGGSPCYSTSAAGAVRNLGARHAAGARSYPLKATPGRIKRKG